MDHEKSYNNDLFSEDLLFRHFSHLTSEEEEAMIAKFIEEDASAKEKYDRYQIFHIDVHAVQSVLASRKNYDEHQAWRSVQGHSQPGKPKYSLNPYLKIAASILLCITVGWIFLRGPSEVPIQLVAEQSIITTELQDGSEITLNKGSVLIHPEKFTESERRVSMKGEAYFEIEKDQNRPFIIDAGNAIIQVLGTSFNVIEVDGAIEVFVDKGLVRMSAGDQFLLLPAGTSGTFNPIDQTLYKKENSIIETHQFWRNKQLVFKGVRLEEVMTTLEEAYGVNVHFENERLKNCTITVTFENESIERILRIISTTLNISITQVNNQIIIDGKTSCNN